MRLLFKREGYERLISQELAVDKLIAIGADTHMAIEAMKGGIPVIADGGEYTIVPNDFKINQNQNP